MFGKKTVKCPAGKWTTLIRSAFTQMPGSWHVALQADDGGEVEGQFAERKTAWVFPQEPRTGVLLTQHQFERGYWNTFYSVSVWPARDVTAEIE